MKTITESRIAEGHERYAAAFNCLKGESTMTFVQRVNQKRRKRLRRARRFKRWMDWLKNAAGISGGFALIWIFAAVIAG